MGKPLKSKSKGRGKKIKLTEKVKVQRKDTTNSVRNDTLPKAPFIMNDNGLNMRIKIKRKSR